MAGSVHRRTRIVGTAAIATALAAATLVALPAPATAAGGGVVISELNYHAVSDLDTDDFLELTNTSASAIDMSGWSFSAGITAVLPSGTIIAPGQRFVLSPSAASFSALHGFAPDAIYSGKLSNGGEEVTLVDASLAVVDTVTYADAAPWSPLADGTGPSLELRGLGFDNTDPDNWGPSAVVGGTPGAVNSLDGTAPLPKVKNLTSTPARPDPGQAFVVSAQLPADSTATLTYKVMFGADVTIPFRDDAASPGGAGDGVYSATIPGQAAGTLVRYRVRATFLGLAFSGPAGDDTITYSGIVVKNPAVSSQLPVVEWFMADSVYNDLLANHRFDDVTGPAVFTYGGEVFDNSAMRVRGNTTRSLAKVSWKIELPAGHSTTLGGQLPYPLDEFALQRESDAIADMGWYAVRQAGARALTILPVRSQRNGQFWSLGRIMETEDGSWRDAQGVSTWSIYKGDGGSVGKQPSVAALQDSLWLDKKTRKTEDYTDAWQLSQVIDAPASAAQRAWILNNVNVPELINYMAINSVIRHQDSGWYNWWIARDTQGSGRWEMWQWDLNWTFTTPAQDGKGVFLTPDTSNKFTKAMLAYPDFKQMFMRRLRTLADQLLAPGRYESLWDATVAPTLPEWGLDQAKWGGYTPASARAQFLSGLADRRTTIASNTGSGLPVPTSQSAAAAAVINEIMYAPVGGPGGQYVELSNPSSTTSVDVSGWTIPELGLTIQPGTVILPGKQVVLVADDVAFRALYPSGDRIVAGRFSTPLSTTGQTLTLQQGTRVVDTVAYSSTAPWPTAAAGTGPSLELKDQSADNALASSWSATSAAGTPGLPNTTTVPPDTTPPTTPTSLTATNLTTTGVTLSWGASTDNRGPVSYEVTRNGAALPRTSALSLNDTGLSPSTSYTYVVRAFDGAGLSSGASNSVVVTTPSATGSLFGDAWTGANGSPWQSAWATNAVTASVVTSNGTGQIALNDTTGAYGRAALTGVAARADSQVVFSYQWNARTAAAYFNVYLRGSGGWQNSYRPRNGYGLEFASNSSTVALKRNLNGTTTTIATSSTAQPSGTGKRWVRLRVSGSSVQFRTWADGATEPSTWTSTVTDTGVSAAGQLYISLVRSSSNSGTKSISLDDLSLLTG